MPIVMLTFWIPPPAAGEKPSDPHGEGAISPDDSPNVIQCGRARGVGPRMARQCVYNNAAPMGLCTRWGGAFGTVV